MYAFVRGTVLSFEDGRIALLVENTGLGLEVLPTPLLLSYARYGEVLEAHIHHHITDVSEALFAFASLEEKRFFRKLLKVDGVGGKTALALLGLGLPVLASAIESGDEKILSGVSGVGKKTALKVIVELKNEVSGSELVSPDAISPSAPPSKKSTKDTQYQTILTSLVGMGYDRRMVEHVLENPELEGKTLEETTVAAIRAMAKR